ncbi:hypothetical protein QO010_003268 [Caulobacter ginsengisoli]|uniref:Uncharacterized protein n=1 Tax=Caulobacter ginsengisoli TaxID=400775 RepID=A0ABU0IWS1_9CAUL|nr:hypothetical protein [Caulobacter ginsengisoli]MDQ0465479.1 hypothetical protein [Caulobacter ginsengisoli]
MRRTLATTLLILAAGGLTPATGQPSRDQFQGLGETVVPANNLLRVIWRETEGEWTGAWSPAPGSDGNGAYRAVWHKGRERASADLQITITGATVTVVRTQAEGRCTYHGNLQSSQAQGRVWATGVYRCDWAPRTLRWRATIIG